MANENHYIFILENFDVVTRLITKFSIFLLCVVAHQKRFGENENQSKTRRITANSSIYFNQMY